MYTAAINLGFPAHRLHLIPWGIETGIFTPGNSDRIETRQRLGFTPDDYIILSPRRIAPICNIDTLILAFKKVSLNFPQLRLALIAFNPIPDYHNKIRSAIGQSGLENKITWLPIVREPSEMAQLYRMSDLVISIPSSEGYGFTVYEAMSTGVPTIISDLPIFHNELLNGVHTLKVPVRDIQATSEAIQKIYLDHSLQQTIVNNAMFICSEKSIDQRMKLVESLYAHTVREWTKKEASL
jgi:glycosyltransferase involved in cell wall biosynthesis